LAQAVLGLSVRPELERLAQAVAARARSALVQASALLAARKVLALELTALVRPVWVAALWLGWSARFLAGSQVRPAAVHQELPVSAQGRPSAPRSRVAAMLRVRRAAALAERLV
jgi:hypothetical protein